MTDLIWVGNTLLPRWFVFGVAAIVILTLVGMFTWFTRYFPARTGA